MTSQLHKAQSQQGSAHVVIILGLLIIILAMLGYIFWHNFVHKPPVAQVTSQTKTTTTPSHPTTPDPYAGWVAYHSDRVGVNLKYPADWKLTDESAQPEELIHLSSPDITKEQNNAPDAVNYDVDVSFEPTTGATTATQLGAVMALKASQNGGSISPYASKEYTDTINGAPVTEFDMLAQSNYFAAVFTVGNNYIVVSFPYAQTKADLNTTLSHILNSVTSSS